ncbi:MAG TPA: NAD(P)-dependent oxidoreductase [Burkholderiaceae bacterium]|nr:NAD(P)-dependent oxidoreductase [Burkholderiaceae bacterium]
MKLALIGATGFVGSALLKELLGRGHQISALVRTPGKLGAPQERLAEVHADALDSALVARAVAGHDAVISAYNPGWAAPDLYAQFMRGSLAIAEGVKQAGLKRLLVVGGAGSLYVAPGVQLVDTPAFLDHVPANIVPGAQAARDELARLRTETGLDWTLISPPAQLVEGPRRGAYRLGGDTLLMNGEQPAEISVADLAVAIADEIETPKHLRQRFTVAY